MVCYVDSKLFSRLLMSAGIGLIIAALAVAGEIPPAPPSEAKATDESQAFSDLFESINRVISGFNAIVRGAIIDPLVDGYQAVTPQPLQEAVSNVDSNISEPVTAVSSLLQGDSENAATATKRFFINTTIRLGGTADPATDMGLEQRKEDLGQAFGANGVAPGPHLVLPIIGPTNFRDVTGDALTALVNPLPLAAKAASSGVNYSDNQDEIQFATEGALDPYIVERDSFEQNRRYKVENGVVPLTAFPELTEEDISK